MIEWKVYNKGERLIPKVTHDIGELIRHESSYSFFKKIIELDLIEIKTSNPIKIIDLGCGVGYGCCILADLPNVQIIGIDNSQEALDYAKTHYMRFNIAYEKVDIVSYISSMPEFDYVIASHVFEHLPNGLHLATLTKWRYRGLFNVPYNECSNINNHHLISHINENGLSEFWNVETFFQDLTGTIHNVNSKLSKPIAMPFICSRNKSMNIKDSDINFPVPAWKFGELLERLNLEIKREEKLIEKINREILEHGEGKTAMEKEKVFYMKKTIRNKRLKIESFKEQIEEIKSV